MGRKFQSTPIKINFDPSKIDIRPNTIVKYSFCQTFRELPVPRFIAHREDTEGKLSLIQHYLLAISDHGVPIRRIVCNRVTCDRDCRTFTGMRPMINHMDVFLKLTDYESALWAHCQYRLGNRITRCVLDYEDVLRTFAATDDEYDFDSESETAIQETYSLPSPTYSYFFSQEPIVDVPSPLTPQLMSPVNVPESLEG